MGDMCHNMIYSIKTYFSPICRHIAPEFPGGREKGAPLFRQQ